MILNKEMLKVDLNSIFKQSKTLITKDNISTPCHFNKHTKVFFDDGVATQITALIPPKNAEYFKIGDIVTINDNHYQISKTEIEAQMAKRLFLKVLND